MQLTASPVKQLALQHGLSVLQPLSLKSEDAQQQIANLQADVMVVAAYGLILPEAVLRLPRYGCLNIHASLLPRWRGAAPIQRAILAGDEQTGITIMQMDVGLDTGDMLLREACAISGDDTAQTLHDRLAQMGAACIVEVLQGLEESGAASLNPVKQDDEAACYAAKLQKSEAAIDWRQDAAQIDRAIRAFHPAQARFNDTVLKIWQAQVCPGHGQPGEVLSVDKSGILVACGKDALRLVQLQRPGGRAQPAVQFLQAMPVQIGEMVG